MSETRDPSRDPDRDPNRDSNRDLNWWHPALRWHSTLGWQLTLVITVSIACESIFLHHGLNLTDEGWPLYAAMRLHAGGTLFSDVFFTFPPGHLLAAWIAYAVDPPGIVLARWIYSGFSVALCAGMLLLGRRIMPARFALLGALLVALAAPQSHSFHLLFGFRYLIFTVLALLAFSQRLRGAGRSWMVTAGVMTGVALCFRVTPAFAAGCGIAVAVLAASRDWRIRLLDWGSFAVGILIIALPVTAWFGWSVGLDVLWREVIARPVAMTIAQSQPLPELFFPQLSDRTAIRDAFIALLFPGSILLYLGYALHLARGWFLSWKTRRTHPDPLLVAVVIWGGVYFLRSLGRSDTPHLDSAIPPLCLLLAHLLGTLIRRFESRRVPGQVPSRLDSLARLGMLAAWIFLLSWDSWLKPPIAERNAEGDAAGAGSRLESLGDTRSSRHWSELEIVDATVRGVARLTEPGETILDLSAAPMFYVLSGRMGPGHADTVMPGTFIDRGEEVAFLERLKRAPPALVILPQRDFDGIPERGLRHSAPRVVAWVERNYQSGVRLERYTLMLPKQSAKNRPGR